MKKLVAVIVLLLLAACSNEEATKNEEMRIVDSMVSLGGGQGESQQPDFEFTISNPEGQPIDEESIEISLTKWAEGRLIEKAITEKRFNEDSITVKGFVLFESKNVSKTDIVENEPIVNGVKLHTENGEELFLERELHTQ